MPPTLIHGVAVLFGVASHICYFKRGEHHLYPWRYVQMLLYICLSTATFLFLTVSEHLLDAMTRTAELVGFFLTGLYTSLLTYRTFLHPLRKFPGPLGARISGFWFTSRLGKFDAFRKLQSLHKKYGDFVRVGPTELSVSHPDAVTAIYGSSSKCTRGPWYDLLYPVVSIQTSRSRTLHDQRRRVWSAAFSDKAMRGYEERIKRFQDQLVAAIEAQKGPINVSQLFTLYSFDVMGDLAFGNSFDMLESQKEHYAIKLLSAGMAPLGLLIPIWFFRLIASIPPLMKDWWVFVHYCWERLDERINTKVLIPDIMSTLLKDMDGRKPTELELERLRGDCELIIVAGSDTTSSTLTSIFHELMRHPDHIPKLRKEIESTQDGTEGSLSHQKLQYLDHLNGVINEAHRLHPPVPSAVQRVTPPEGMMIGDVRVPGNIVVWAPQYVLGRNENIYIDPDDFVPERWYSKPEMIKEKTAFAPFLTGPYNCIGKPLALLNLRVTVARIVMAFDINYAPLEDGTVAEKDTRDYFVAAPGALRLSFTKR